MSTATEETLSPWETAVARAAVYELLTRVLAFPTPAQWKRLVEGVLPVASGVATGDPAIDGPLAEVLGDVGRFAAAVRGGRVLDELRDAHQRLFTHIEPEDCPPYETAYEPGDVFRQSDTMADVGAFYRAHGVQVGGAERERPDHLVTELEFMALMAVKEAHARKERGPDDVAECVRTQSAFLSEHLGRWAPSTGRRIAVVGTSALLRDAGSLLAAWLELDMEQFGVAPLEVLDEPVPRPEPDDGACGAEMASFGGTVDPAVGADPAVDPVPVEFGARRGAAPASEGR